MNRRTWIKITPALSSFLVATGVALSAEAAQEMALRRVMLSTGGVGYFEYEATVQGNADLSFSLRSDQISDMLKSVVVFDDQGKVGSVTLPGPDPLHEILRDMPFDKDDLSSPVALLNALTGAEVRVQTKQGEFVGRILSVNAETVEIENKGKVTRHRLTVMTSAGMIQPILEDTTVEFVDPVLQQKIDKVLAAIAAVREHGPREITVHMNGQGERLVRVGYVVEAPLWKASYHLMLPAHTAEKSAELFGWSILENLSGKDWQDVDLTVVSGNPVTFRQALYDAYYVERPLVPVAVVGRILPLPDVGAMPMPVSSEAPRAPAMRAFAAGGAGMALGDARALEAAAPLRLPEATEALTQVVFHFPEPVTVQNAESVLLPIVSGAFPAERVSHFQPETHKRHPVDSVRLENNRSFSIPPGALTIYQQAEASGTLTYLGDARLSPFPVGEERLIGFALDQKVEIDKEVKDKKTIVEASIVEGVMKLKVIERRTTTYIIDGAADDTRSVLLEHPRMAGWELTSPIGSGITMTEDSYRIPVEVAKGATMRFEVILERPRRESIAITSLKEDQIAYYLSSSELAPPVRAALKQLSVLRAIVAERQKALEVLKNELDQIAKEQERIRGNLKVTPQGSSLHQRYLDKLAQQEDQIDDLKGRMKNAQIAVDQAKKNLADYIRTLRLD